MFTGLFRLAWQPLAQICGDNKQANCWAGTKPCETRRPACSARLLAASKWFRPSDIPGPESWIADDFSPRDNEKVQSEFKGYSPTKLSLLAQAKIDSQKLRLSRFHLTPVSVSLLASAILHPNTVDLPDGKPSEWGQIVPGEPIMFSLPAPS